MDWGLIVENAVRSAFDEDAIIYALAAIGLNIHFGFTGLYNFGQVAFLAVGAYSVAIGVANFGWSLWLAMFLGLLAAIVLALILGVPTLRLRGDYLAIVTIAAGEILRLVFRANTFRDVAGGSDGLQNFGNQFFDANPLPQSFRFNFLVWDLSRNESWLLLVGWTIVLLAALLTFLLMRSPWGRIVKAIREDEDAVRSLGKNVYWYKMQSLITGGLLGAIAGIIFALSRQSVQPDNYSTNATFFAYTALFLGGAATIFGPILGSIIFWAVIQFTDVFLAQLSDTYDIAFLGSDERGAVRLMLVGVMLMVLMIYRPQGILGDPREVAVSARR
jgi:branched-chain amino acid transport system permease protein